MQEVFEKIKERLEEEKKAYSELVAIHFAQRNNRLAYVYKEKELAIKDAIEIVNQVAEEYTTECEKNGYINALDDAIEKFLEYGCICVEWNKGLSKEKLVDDVLRQAVGQVVYILEKMKIKVAEEYVPDINVGNNDGWIPCSEKTPEFEIYTLTPVWVTMRRKDGTYHFVTRLKWNGYHGRWEWNNGKTVSDTWEIIAWQKVNYPAPYQPKGE